MLIKCPECELQVSDKALSCPHCGYPMKQEATKTRKKQSNKRRRLPNGFGQISEIKNRNLRNPFRAMVTVGKTDGGRPICKPLKPESYFPTYNDAYAALVEYNKNPYDLELSTTMAELYEKWSNEYFNNSSKTSIQTYKRGWKYCSSIYEFRVIDIRAKHIKNCMYDGVAEINGNKQKANERTRRSIKSLFNMLFDYAIEYGITETNYARSYKPQKEKIIVKKEHIPFTEEEIGLLWDNIDKVEGVDTLLIQCYSGWRPSELCLLKLSDINLDTGFMKGGSKTEAGINRQVPIHSKIRPLIEKKYNKAKELGCEYLFTSKIKGSDDIHLSYSRYHAQFVRLLYKLNLNLEHRLHDARKHFISMAKKYNVDEYAIKIMAGHTINDITEKIYTKRDPEWFHQEIEKIK